MKTTSYVAGFVALVSLVACSSSSDGTGGTGSSTSSASSSSSSAIVGDAICGKLHECNAKVDLQTCGAEFDIPSLDRLRGDYRQRIADCFSASDCAWLSSNGGADRVDACFEEAIVYITPSDAVGAFCTSLVAAAEHCDSTVSYGTCLNGYKQYSDEHVAQLQACTEKSCSTMVSCIKAETK